MQLYYVSVLPYGEPCLQQHTALLSGVAALLYPSFIHLIQYQERSSERGNPACALWLSLCPLPVKVLGQDALEMNFCQWCLRSVSIPRDAFGGFCGWLLRFYTVFRAGKQ